MNRGQNSAPKSRSRTEWYKGVKIPMKWYWWLFRGKWKTILNIEKKAKTSNLNERVKRVTFDFKSVLKIVRQIGWWCDLKTGMQSAGTSTS